MMQTLRAIFLELAVEAAIVAEEQAEFAPKFHAELTRLPRCRGRHPVRTMSPCRVQAGVPPCPRRRARPPSWTPYANFLLQCGVVFGPHETTRPASAPCPSIRLNRRNVVGLRVT